MAENDNDGYWEEPMIASPNGIPPWEPPDDSGEWLAYEGWVDWVEHYGSLSHRLQLLGYRVETATKTIVDAFIPAMKSAADNIMKFAAAFAKSDE